MLLTLATVAACGLGYRTAPARASAEAPEVSYFSFFEGWEGERYALDDEPRWLEEHTRVHCDTVSMVRYRSQQLHYTAIVHPAFVPRLQRFDALVMSLSQQRYGRAPRRLLHAGAFACRSSRVSSERISEHALGNAIDFQGLDFGPLARKQPAPADMPQRFRQAFSVRVASHWFARNERDRYHAEFLHELAETLRARPDVFRGIVGPPRPRHGSHLHLDAAPWRYAMFGYDRGPSS